MDNGMSGRKPAFNGTPTAGQRTVHTTARTASWQLTGKITVPDDRTGRTVYDLPAQPLPQIASQSGRVRNTDISDAYRTEDIPSQAYRRSFGTAKWQTETAPMSMRNERASGEGVPRADASRDRTGRNPFEEPGVSPELQNARNPEMFDKSSEFWKEEQNGSEEERGKERKHNRSVVSAAGGEESRHLRNVILSTVALFLLLAVTGLIVFRVREIKVAGCSHVSAETVVACSGITTKDNLLLLNEKKIEEGINSNRYLQYVCIERNAPSSVTIRVQERVPIAYMSYCGIRYIMDKSLMVLEEEHEIGSLKDMIEIKGLKPKSCFLGARVVAEGEQGTVYTEMMREIRVLGIRDMIVEIDISDPQNIYLLTADGMSVSLGDRRDIHAKLRSMVLTREELIRRGLTGGSINVSKPENPTYVPFEM